MVRQSLRMEEASREYTCQKDQLLEVIGGTLNLLRILAVVVVFVALGSSQELIDPSALNARFQSRLKSLAGENAIACGDVAIKGNTEYANACAQDAFRSGKPFYVSYQGQGFDSVGSIALAMDSAKNFYSLISDSMGFAPHSLGKRRPILTGAYSSKYVPSRML